MPPPSPDRRAVVRRPRWTDAALAHAWAWWRGAFPYLVYPGHPDPAGRPHAPTRRVRLRLRHVTGPAAGPAGTLTTEDEWDTLTGRRLPTEYLSIPGPGPARPAAPTPGSPPRPPPASATPPR